MPNHGIVVLQVRQDNLHGGSALRAAAKHSLRQAELVFCVAGRQEFFDMFLPARSGFQQHAGSAAAQLPIRMIERSDDARQCILASVDQRRDSGGGLLGILFSQSLDPLAHGPSLDHGIRLAAAGWRQQ